MGKFSLRSRPRENQVKMTRAWIPKVTERNQNHPVPWRTSRIRAFYHSMMKKMEIYNDYSGYFEYRNLLLAYHHCHHWRALAREHTILCIVGLQLTSWWPCQLIRTNLKVFPLGECKFYKITNITWGGAGGGGLIKVLFEEALPQSPTSDPYIYHFGQKRYPFHKPSIDI